MGNGVLVVPHFRCSSFTVMRKDHPKTKEIGKLQESLYALIIMSNIVVHNIKILFLLFQCPFPRLLFLELNYFKGVKKCNNQL
jgi:hypothetical protein